MPIEALAGEKKSEKTFLDELPASEKYYRIMIGKIHPDKQKSCLRSKESSKRASEAVMGDNSETEMWLQGQARYCRDTRALQKKEEKKKLHYLEAKRVTTAERKVTFTPVYPPE